MGMLALEFWYLQEYEMTFRQTLAAMGTYTSSNYYQPPNSHIRACTGMHPPVSAPIPGGGYYLVARAYWPEQIDQSTETS